MESETTKQHQDESSNNITCGIITLSDSRDKKEDLSNCATTEEFYELFKKVAKNFGFEDEELFEKWLEEIDRRVNLFKRRETCNY